MKLVRCLFVAALLLFPSLYSAHASASPAPIWHWVASSTGEELYVNDQNGTCSLLTQGAIQVQGPCSWAPSSNGGILTITYPMPLEPGKVYLNVVRVDARTISISGVAFQLE